MKPHCKICGGKMQSRGRRKSFVLGIKREVPCFWCRKCDSWHYEPSRHSRPAKILVLDIETLPGEYYSFSPKVEYLTPDKQIKDVSLSCWAAKWLFEPEIMGEVVSPKDAVERRDGKILEKIWRLVSEADIVVHQNGTSFDMPTLNWRWMLHGYTPPSRYLYVDTLKVANQKFKTSYRRLDELGKRLGIGKKHDMSFIDWRLCVEGSVASRKQALEKQLNYCKNDIAPLLEDVYLHMLPWIDNHPNMNVFAMNDQPCCRNCASTKLNWETEEYITPQGKWMGWRCITCGATGRGTTKEYNIWKTHVK